MSDMLPPSVQFLASPDTPGSESLGRPLVAKIPGSHPPPGSSAALETIAQSLFSHDLRHRQYVREGEATGLPFSNFLHHLLTPGGYVLPGDLGHVIKVSQPGSHLLDGRAAFFGLQNEFCSTELQTSALGDAACVAKLIRGP